MTKTKDGTYTTKIHQKDYKFITGATKIVVKKVKKIKIQHVQRHGTLQNMQIAQQNECRELRGILRQNPLKLKCRFISTHSIKQKLLPLSQIKMRN